VKRRGLNRVRIIGGQWRGRRIEFANVQGLRPTGDRLRETLFDWLQREIRASRCLDLFAGSGALGLEAASRGAREVVLVESDPRVAGQLRCTCQQLCARQVRVHGGRAEDYVRAYGKPFGKPFDIVFLDPPFHRPGVLDALCDQLEGRDLLNTNGRVYLEFAAAGEAPSVPARWRILHDKTFGKVRVFLLQV
jgi:16S rRNA (guanine966-N2)-methyltransferase